ncbi:MAG: class I SAM-dependent methyltransferase [Corynebacterium sp.]|uniref:SAM-dependent methyltransferase n=1 Tax=Corynebacterium TaxID=1716 RepID=UPI00264971F8|nr:class I SAM-dependent methyltransferase [Corynebacterium sp.]MDN6304507.1 class I SAM-dependent methyltransferase [Corynebacterium sp.]MDN6352712.1 class I SAM-dependent methyltransferase [Corynebacterium sp.]MDN6366294.1 class I SAM-dependent methyltransferase [Corynebacterium sp.]MDN6395100.1 class I SAM-dependent methyltransferase [Corynebacterium sp.]
MDSEDMHDGRATHLREKDDRYAATAGAYDLFAAGYRAGQVAALDAVRPKLLPRDGPILDIGAGSGLNSVWVLTHVPDSEVVALEPSPSMRALALGRVAEHPEWFTRITVRPEDFFSAPLPPTIGGAILLGVLGHFDPGERAAVLAELAARLPEGGAALIDLQDPETPARVEPFEFTAAQIGQLSYRGIAEAWPDGGERMRWRMTYLTLDGERVLLEDTTEHVFHHPSPGTVAAEASRAGLGLERVGETTFWLLTRDQASGSAAS